MKKYEVEIQRRDVTPREFWSYCRRQIVKRTGSDLLTSWCDSFEAWTLSDGVIRPCNDKYEHNNWDVPAVEVCKMLPYEWQLYLGHTYNFIMEFDFWDDKRGFGYLYLTEEEG